MSTGMPSTRNSRRVPFSTGTAISLPGRFDEPPRGLAPGSCCTSSERPMSVCGRPARRPRLAPAPHRRRRTPPRSGSTPPARAAAAAVLLREVGGALRPLGLALGPSTHLRGLHRLDLAREIDEVVSFPPAPERWRRHHERQPGEPGPMAGSNAASTSRRRSSRMARLVPSAVAAVSSTRSSDPSREVFERLRQELHSLRAPRGVIDP